MFNSLEKLSDIPLWRKYEIELFALSVFGGELSKLNANDDLKEGLDEIWKLGLSDGTNLIDVSEWSKIEVPIAKAIATATQHLSSEHEPLTQDVGTFTRSEVAIAEATWQSVSPKRESRPPLSCNYEMSALLFNTTSQDSDEEVYAVRFDDPAGDIKRMSQQGEDDLNVDGRSNTTTIEIKPRSVLVFPSYLRHVIYGIKTETDINVIKMQIVFPHRLKNPAIMEHNFEIEKESITPTVPETTSDSSSADSILASYNN